MTSGIAISPAGGKGTGNTAGMLGFQQHPNDPAAQAQSGQATTMSSGMANIETTGGTQKQRRASRRRQSAHAKQDENAGIVEKDAAKTPHTDTAMNAARVIRKKKP